MARWNEGTWNSGLLWGPASPPPSPNNNQNKHKKHTMKRQHYFPKTVGARAAWFTNLATQLPIANVTLALPALAVTAIVADANYCAYVTGDWLTAVREFGPPCTSAVEMLLSGVMSYFVN